MLVEHLAPSPFFAPNGHEGRPLAPECRPRMGKQFDTPSPFVPPSQACTLMSAPHSDEDLLVDKLNAHKSTLLSSRRCKEGWIADPDTFFAPTVLGVTPGLWGRHNRKALA